MGMMGGYMGGWGWGVVGLAVMLLFWGGVIGLVVYGARDFGRGVSTPVSARNATADRAPALLRERFARGEIDRTEYEDRRATLLDAPPGR